MSGPDPDPAPEPPALPSVLAPQLRRSRWQLGLRTVLLLTAAVAVWLAYAMERRRIDDLTARIAVARPLARELIVDDPGKIAVVKQEEFWFDENRWELHLPAGRRYRLRLATRGITQGGFPPASASAALTPGRHVVALDQVSDAGGWRIDADCDEKRLLSVSEPKEWDPGTGSEGGGAFALTEQFAPDRPVVLFRRRFMGIRDARGRSPTPQGPTVGVMLWIEPDASEAASSERKAR